MMEGELLRSKVVTIPPFQPDCLDSLSGGSQALIRKPELAWATNLGPHLSTWLQI